MMAKAFKIIIYVIAANICCNNVSIAQEVPHIAFTHIGLTDKIWPTLIVSVKKVHISKEQSNFKRNIVTTKTTFNALQEYINSHDEDIFHIKAKFYEEGCFSVAMFSEDGTLGKELLIPTRKLSIAYLDGILIYLRSKRNDSKVIKEVSDISKRLYGIDTSKYKHQK